MSDPKNEPTIPDASLLEHEFFQREPGAPRPADWVDPELERLPVSRGSSGSSLLLLVTAVGVFLGSQYVSELTYFFSSRTPVDLGAIEEIRLNPEWMAGGRLTLPSNRYVALEGIPERRSVADDSTFYKLIGAHIYVETRGDEGSRVIAAEDIVDPDAESYRAAHNEPGRLIAFEDLSSRYNSVVKFYSDSYGIAFCGHEPSPEVRAFRNNVRSRGELELRDTLGREPTADELAAHLGPESDCTRGYLLISGHSPQSYLGILTAWIGLLVMVGFSVWRLVRTLGGGLARGRR